MSINNHNVTLRGSNAGRESCYRSLVADDRFDAIVLGDGLGPLVSAATLATARRRVAWIPHERPSWWFSAGGRPFPVEDGPVVGSVDDDSIRGLAHATGIPWSELKELRSADPPLQVVTPRLRVDLVPANGAVAQEVNRETGVPTGAVLDYLTRLERARAQSLPYLERAALGSIRKVDPKEPSPHDDLLGIAPSPIQPIARAVASALGRREVGALNPMEAARLLAAVRGGLLESPRGPLTLRETLLDRLRAARVTILRERSVKALRQRFGRVRAVDLDDGSRLAATVVMSALDPRRSPPVVGGLLGPRRIPAPAQIVSDRFTLHLVVGIAVLPIGMGPRVVLATEDGDDAMLVSRHPGDDADEARVTVTRRLPADCPPSERIVAMRGAFDRLRGIVPFLEDDLRGVFPAIGHARDLEPDHPGDPWEHVRTPGYFRVPSQSRPFKSGLRGVVRTGADCLPGLGLEGELAAGVGSARYAVLR